MDCSTERLPDGYSRTAENADGYICGSPQHIERFFIGCRDRRPVSIHLCSVDGKNHTLYCAGITDGEESQYQLTWVDAKNYICTNPRDLEYYLDWCFR